MVRMYIAPLNNDIITIITMGKPRREREETPVAGIIMGAEPFVLFDNSIAIGTKVAVGMMVGKLVGVSVTVIGETVGTKV